jgi:hypothetical protein
MMKLQSTSRKAALAVLCAVTLVAAPAAIVAGKDEGPVKVTSAKNIKGTQQVVVGQFTVAFLIERKDSTKAGGGLLGGGFGGRSTVRSYLAGYSPADLQSVADAAYEDFVAKLSANGFTVADRAGFAAHPAIAKLAGEPGPKEMSTATGKDDKAKVVLVGASQTGPLRLMAGDVVAGGFGAMGMAMSGNQAANAFTAYAKANGTRVVNAIYYVDFADSEEYGGWFRSSSAVKVKGSLALLPVQTKVTVIGPDYKSGSVALSNPVAVGGDFFDTEDAMGSGEKIGNAVGKVIGILGGVGSNSSKKIRFTARPGTYAPGAIQATTQANTVFAQSLAGLR